MQGIADPVFTDDNMVVLFVKIASGVVDENIVILDFVTGVTSSRMDHSC
jgi:hypothetical protein